MNLKKVSLITLVITLFTTPIVFNHWQKHYGLLTISSANSGGLPKAFRLTHLPASGSAQFSEKNYEEMIDAIPSENIVIVDLRQEPHGFLNGHAISWFSMNNWLFDGKGDDEIYIEEKEKLNTLSKSPITTIFYERLIPYPYQVSDVNDEETFVTQNGQTYLRIPVRDHSRPSDDAVDKFISYVKNSPKDQWLHFHCAAGKGRTSTFLVMFDIINGGYQDSLNEVIKRQYHFGGTNLANTEGGWKTDLFKERIDFLSQFHQYVVENPDLLKLWSDH